MREHQAKVANVLVTLASHCDFCFKGSSTSFSENKMIVELNSNCCDCSIKKNRKKLYGFWQTDMVECLINERKLLMMKLDYVGLIYQKPLIQRNCSMLSIATRKLASTINNFAS